MIPETSKLILFAGATLLLLVVPGPAVLYVVTRSVDQGWRAGIASTVGIGVGTLFHVAAAALGLSAILLSSALAFNVVKYAGAAYLIYLGVRRIISPAPLASRTMPMRDTLRRAFLQGIVVNILNPKTALFFFAFLPQFVDVSRGSVTAQVLFLGTVFVFMGVISDGCYALLAGRVGYWLRTHAGFLRAQRLFAGTVYIALGLVTALSGSGKAK